MRTLIFERFVRNSTSRPMMVRADVSGSGATPGKYTVTVRPAALQDLQSIAKKVRKKQRKRIGTKIARLETQPRPRGSKKLAGSDNEYRLRDGDFRILYTIDESKHLVRVGRILDRKDSYKGR